MGSEAGAACCDHFGTSSGRRELGGDGITKLRGVVNFDGTAVGDELCGKWLKVLHVGAEDDRAPSHERLGRILAASSGWREGFSDEGDGGVGVPVAEFASGVDDVDGGRREKTGVRSQNRTTRT